MLSQTSQYALRIMSCIAVARGAQPVRAKLIAQSIDCPPAYVSKVSRKLVEAGLLRAEKGHGGGFILGRSPEKIFFRQILDAVQPTQEKKQCIFGWRRCDSKAPCILHHRWNAVSGAFNEWAKKTTLADIQSDATASKWILRVSEPTP